ncbi:hypothetical protein LDENG_00105760 [Lucifuga dentata]|nr:hypothetical protein LDENG_00105760 [Lucifuga dentata]
MAAAEALGPSFLNVQPLEHRQFVNMCKVGDCGGGAAGGADPLIEVEFSIVQSPALPPKEEDDLGQFLDLEFILSNTVGSDVVSHQLRYRGILQLQPCPQPHGGAPHP